MEIKIGKYVLNENSECFVIAEIGNNHQGSLKNAIELVNVAKNCGANAVKFQLFNAKKLYPNNHKMYKIFKSIELNSSWIKDLKKYSDKVKIDFICSAFDLESAKIVNKYVDTHKVASSEATNINLLKYLVKTKKKILFSTGMCDQIDINNFLKIFKVGTYIFIFMIIKIFNFLKI